MRHRRTGTVQQPGTRPPPWAPVRTHFLNIQVRPPTCMLEESSVSFKPGCPGRSPRETSWFAGFVTRGRRARAEPRRRFRSSSRVVERTVVMVRVGQFLRFPGRTRRIGSVNSALQNFGMTIRICTLEWRVCPGAAERVLSGPTGDRRRSRCRAGKPGRRAVQRKRSQVCPITKRCSPTCAAA